MKIKQDVQLYAVVGTDPIIKYLPKGYMLAVLVVATHEQTETGKGAPLQITIWHKIKVWNEMAFFVSRNIKKGNRVRIDGEIARHFEGANGQKKMLADIKAKSITLLN